MPLKLTTDIFIKRAIEKHGDFYNYDDTLYTIDTEKVEIRCPIHGLFKQKPSAHMSGFRCIKCSRESQAEKMAKSISDFIEHANKVHNFKYTYDNAIYTKRRNCYITITCRKHGDFKQLVDKHLSGQGCKKCAIEEQKPSVGFTKGAWIKHCKNKNVNTTFCYILRLYNENESFIKIGITYDLTLRVSKIPYNIETIYLIKDSPDVVYDKEQELHKKYKNLKYKPQIPFNGHRECFNLNILK